MGRRGPKPGTPAKGGSRKTLFKKNQVANPSGVSSEIRRARMELDKIMLKYLAETVEAKDAKGNVLKMPRFALQINKLFKESVEGDKFMEAIEAMWNRAWGMPKQKQDINHSGSTGVVVMDDIPPSKK